MAETSSNVKQPHQPVSGDAPTQAGGALDPTLPVPPGTKPIATSPINVSPGSNLGPYVLIELLGRGGMGTVWKAKHTKLDKLVALKLLPPHLMTDPDAVNRFEREMKAVGKLEHPHIVRAMDAGQADGMHYLVMEYIEGADLSRIVKNRGPRSVAEACQMIRHAALGLAHAHEHGLVHRDIKPSNLLLSKKGLVKILDLGLARLQSERTADETSLTLQGETMGTPDYMAPEQWQSAHTAGPPSDLYALGCTLYHLLVGHPPFSGKEHSSFGQKLTAHVTLAPPPLSTSRADVPAEVEALYQRLLAKDPVKRPASAKQLADELRAMLRGWTKSPALPETIAWPQPPSAPRHARSWTRTITVAVAGALLATVLATLAFRPAKHSPSRVVPQKTGQTSAARPVPTQAPAMAIAPFGAAQAVARKEAWAYYLGTPVEYTNSLGMKFCLIPPGEYDRGTEADRLSALLKKKGAKVKGKMSAESERAIRSEIPRHRVRITQPFYLSKYEVTQDQFLRIMGFNPAEFSQSGTGRGKVSARDHERLPVENISFAHAQDFCQRLTESESAPSASPPVANDASPGYRLPTDAEWEYACRAGTINWYCCGGAESEIGKYGWLGKPAPAPVGSLRSNAFGLFDMHGNVWEICADYFAEDGYASVGKLVESPTGPPTGSARVRRGGGFSSAAISCRSASRNAFDGPRDTVGFRPALSVDFVRAQLTQPPAQN